MSVHYTYQLIQALDDKIGPDLRRLVEGYLGSSSKYQRTLHNRAMETISSKWGGPGCPSTFLARYGARAEPNADWLMAFCARSSPAK